MNNIVNTLAKAISIAVIAVVAKEMTRAIELDWRKGADGNSPTGNYYPENPYDYDEGYNPYQ